MCAFTIDISVQAQVITEWAIPEQLMDTACILWFIYFIQVFVRRNEMNWNWNFHRNLAFLTLWLFQQNKWNEMRNGITRLNAIRYRLARNCHRFSLLSLRPARCESISTLHRIMRCAQAQSDYICHWHSSLPRSFVRSLACSFSLLFISYFFHYSKLHSIFITIFATMCWCCCCCVQFYLDCRPYLN